MVQFEAVVVDGRKLREYCLSGFHHRGRNKARVFRARLGLSDDDVELLRDALLRAADSRPQDLRLRNADQYGRHYILDFEMTNSGRVATIRSIWIIRQNEDVLRLVTCFVR